MILWHSKKQTLVALATTEAEYIVVGSCGTQILWIMHRLLDFNLSFEFVPVMYDNTSAIILSKYTLHHSRAKHNDIKYHFIWDHVESDNFSLVFVDSKNQLTNIFTKPLLEKIFCYLRKRLGITNIYDL